MASYTKALANTPNPKALKARQRAWLKSARGRCQTVECLKLAYTTRLSELNQVVATPAEVKSGFDPVGNYRYDKPGSFGTYGDMKIESRGDRLEASIHTGNLLTFPFVIRSGYPSGRAVDWP
jgi:uncharacterized protein